MSKPSHIKVTAKCSDLCSIILCEEDGRPIAEHDGYVPSWLPANNVEHFGDYVELTIDLATGKILNWQKPTKKQLKGTFPKL